MLLLRTSNNYDNKYFTGNQTSLYRYTWKSAEKLTYCDTQKEKIKGIPES